MGGHRSSSHAVDRIAPRSDPEMEDNPFIVSTADPNPFLVSPFETRKTSPLFLSGISGQDGITTPPGRLMRPPAEPTSPSAAAAWHAASRTRQRQADAVRRREQEAKRKEMVDEDNNPFLLKPGESVQPKRNGDDAHQPYVTYVFRGTKRIFANPFIPSDTHLPSTKLHPNEEDFEEHPCPRPRLLWPTLAKTTTAANDERFAEEVTPSPPSSPLLQTPQTRPRERVEEVDDAQGESGGKRKAVTELQAGRRVKVSRRL